MLSTTRLLPRNELDEFGHVIDFLEYVSETFPVQTDVCIVTQKKLAFMMHNYTDVVGAILDAKMQKIFKADPRITYTIETGPEFWVPEDRALVTIKWPSEKYRTARTLSVYTNLDTHLAFFNPKARNRPATLYKDFIDAGRIVHYIEEALAVVKVYTQDASYLDLSNSAPRKGWKTGAK